jgi:hypothetical protein
MIFASKTFISVIFTLLVGFLIGTSQKNVVAQSRFTFVAPGGAANVEGDSQTPFLGDRQNGRRVQEFITPAALPNLPSSGVWLTDLSFRGNVAPAPVEVGARTVNYDRIEITIGTTTAPVSQNLDVNLGPNKSLVLSGSSLSFVIPPPPPIGPSSFSLSFKFDTPFYYRPEAGNLVVDFRVFGGGILSDYVSMPISQTMYYLFEQVQGVAIVDGGPPLEFGYTLVPEPSTFFLFSTSACVLLFCSKLTRNA